ncbi:MAG: PD-(D/E)XK nuclease family protein [Deltaproteobacteria bacterium]|nr:PD-(D/E)XK nuclease family protein [Deltaproteobacteria bacterium]
MVDPVYKEFSQLLDEFSRIWQPPPEQTILEIAGYAHYEIVASNILKFFLDPEQNHGLQTSVLESLLAAAGKITSDPT